MSRANQSSGEHRRRRLTFVWPARGDVIAGISVALVLIPQSMAYAELAGLQPIHGLYAAAAAPILAALVGSSPYLQTGPVALTSLLTLGALAPLAEEGTAVFAAHAALLALLVGVVRVIIGLLRWGAVAYLMSLPVMAGFTAAAALLIISSQVPSLFGVQVDASSPILSAGQALAQPGGWSLIAIAVGLATVALVLGGRRVSKIFPWVLAASLIGLLASQFGLINIATVGHIPSGFLPLSLALPWQALPNLVVPAILIAIVGFAEAASISRRYAAEDRTRWDPGVEFVGQGLANIAAGVAGGYPAGGSFSRSALNRLTGARTKWSGAITGVTVLAVLPFAGVLSSLPQAVLAGLVIVAAISLVDLRPFGQFWRHSRPQFLVAVPTFVATLITAPRVELGLLIGVGLALAVHLWRESRLEVESWRDGELLHVRPHGVLYFGSAHALEARLSELLDEHADGPSVAIHLDRIGRLDLTGLYALRELSRQAGTTFEFRDVPPHAADRFRAVMDDGSGSKET